MFSMWVIYERPRDYPEQYVARRLRANSGGGVITLRGDVILGDTLDEVRARLKPFGLHRIARDPRDEPQVVETWL
ncbi:hypothetical protein DPV79_15950 [Burkholderia reimsis]|uniref:Uncharacterized protein n=1 Tax=Burkholderia reimsis TaxID=2234132 RepID=A0A365QUQ0_9BURK|nr:hypothetical protein [Burkholderia reimsis]RBB38872.1 hypothetical protein DPV79_15950 [Burkholderia reimsis]